MFEFLKTKKSLVRTELKTLMWVRDSWFEWTIEGGRCESVLVVAMGLDLDPNGAHFKKERIDEVARTVARCAAAEKGPDRVRIVPHHYYS